MNAKVAVLVGSLRTDSLNRRLAFALERHAPGDWEFEHANLAGLPLYDDDLLANSPQSVRDFKALVAGADAVMIVSPEYNRSMPGVLKNAIDWASRPKAENVFAHKPTMIAGASTGRVGTAVMQAHLRTSLAYLDAPTMGQPEVYITFDPPDLISADGTVTVPGTDEFLARVMQRFEAWLDGVRG